MLCSICGQREADVGVLCESCREALAGPFAISPEQLEHHANEPTPSALVDLWGRVYLLDARSLVGRKHQTITILVPSVSREHAELLLDEDWTVRDLGSRSGTFVGGQRVTEPTPLHNGSIVTFGHVAFYFLQQAPPDPPRPRRAISETARHVSSTTLDIDVSSPPVLSFTFQEPTGGGGGFVEIEGVAIQLTVAQLELVRLLVDRMIAEIDRDDATRGFVPATELQKLSLESTDPGYGHISHLIRRVRRRLIDAGVGDLIESQHGQGYRLRALPRVTRTRP